MFEARDKHTKYIPKKKQVFKMDQLICRAFTQHIIMGLKTQASYIQSLHTGYCVPPMHKAPKCSWVQIFWNFTFAPPPMMQESDMILFSQLFFVYCF